MVFWCFLGSAKRHMSIKRMVRPWVTTRQMSYFTYTKVGGRRSTKTEQCEKRKTCFTRMALVHCFFQNISKLYGLDSLLLQKSEIFTGTYWDQTWWFKKSSDISSPYHLSVEPVLPIISPLTAVEQVSSKHIRNKMPIPASSRVSIPLPLKSPKSLSQNLW